MANISIKKDFEDGQKLFAQQLNNNFETIELGINSGNKLIWKDDNGAEFQTFRGTTEEIENRPIIDGQELYNIENGDTFLDVGETRKDMNKPLWKDDNGAQIQSFRGTTAEVAARPIIDGQTLYNIETGETALDVGDKRISTGAGNVVYIGDEEPQNDATKIWIENDQVLNLGSEVAISSEEPTTQEKVWLQRSRNLLDSIATTQTINGVDFTVNPDKTIKVNGTATSQIVFPITNDIVLDGTYRLSGCPIGGSASTYEIQFYGTNGAVDYGQNNAIVSNAKGIVRIVIRNGATLNNLIFKPQLEQGEVATPYEPYTPKKIHTKTDNGVYEEFYNEENREVYSTEEQRIGTYLGKPLYRKTYVGTTDILLKHGVYVFKGFPYIDKLVSHKGFITFVDSEKTFVHEIGCYESDIHFSGIQLYKDGGDLRIFGGDGYAIGSTYDLTIEYTKTTD